MAQVGFVFEDHKTHEKHVVFIESNKIKTHCMIGFVHLLHISSISSFNFLTKQLELQNHLYLDNAKTPYTKISVSKKNSCYIDDLTVWVEPILYKKLYYYFHIQDNSAETIISNTNSIVEILNL